MLQAGQISPPQTPEPPLPLEAEAPAGASPPPEGMATAEAATEAAPASGTRVIGPPWLSRLMRPDALLVISFFVMCSSIVLYAFLGAVVCWVALAFSCCSAAFSITHLVRRAAGRPLPTDLSYVASAITLVLASFWSLVGWVIAMVATVGFHRGRQLRSFGRVLLPRVEPGEAWTGPRDHDLAAIPADARAALAEQWRDNARTEHASVAAFARLTLDLIELGAPPSLIADAQRDALDEIRHAELCFGLARALDGRSQGPAPFPEATRARTLAGTRAMKLAALAVDSLVDGALHEGTSARVIARLARRCEVPSITAMLRQIASDEGRHAAHGWDVVLWCLDEGGEPVREALRGAIAALPAEVRSPLPAGAAEGGWERWGIHGHALEASEHRRARAFLASRVGALASRLAA